MSAITLLHAAIVFRKMWTRKITQATTVSDLTGNQPHSYNSYIYVTLLVCEVAVLVLLTPGFSAWRGEDNSGAQTCHQGL